MQLLEKIETSCIVGVMSYYVSHSFELCWNIPQNIQSEKENEEMNFENKFLI